MKPKSDGMLAKNTWFTLYGRHTMVDFNQSAVGVRNSKAHCDLTSYLYRQSVIHTQ